VNFRIAQLILCKDSSSLMMQTESLEDRSQCFYSEFAVLTCRIVSDWSREISTKII
jgi:hypothetical protein